MGASVSRNARLLKYFVQQYPGIPRKRLVKLVYMADIISRQFLGRPISTFEYRLDKFGPYDPAIEDDVVYETSPMKDAEVFRAPLRMELVDNEGRKAVGFDLEAVIRAERQAETGNHATLGAFLDGLRTRIATRHSK